MKEYRVMYNYYDGKGDQVIGVYNNLIKAIEVKYDLYKLVINDKKGVAWIEAREVNSWKKIEIR